MFMTQNKKNCTVLSSQNPKLLQNDLVDVEYQESMQLTEGTWLTT